jgi:spoIIIJ-associated protein
MKYAEKWGDSIDGAVDLALQDLGLTRDQVTVTVLEQPSKGFFGIGSKLAKVRVEEIAKEEPKEEPKAKEAAPEKEYRKPVKTEEVQAEPEETEEETAEGEESPRKQNSRRRDRNRNRKRKDRKASEKKDIAGFAAENFVYEEGALLSEKPENLVEAPDCEARKFLDSMFREMGIDVSVKVYTNDECVYAEVDGPDCGTVIGKRGQTLDAIQYLTSLVVNKDNNSYIRTIIDAEGYRRKRELTLEKLAIKLAEKAIKNGRSVRLEPMNPYERKVIHSVLQKYPGVSTRSEGEEPYRRVVIEPSK